MTRLGTFVLALGLVLSLGCEDKKPEDGGNKGTTKAATSAPAGGTNKAEPAAADVAGGGGAAAAANADAAAGGGTEAKADAGGGGAATPAPAAAGEYIKFNVNHHDKDAPVDGSFKTFTLVKATVDLADLTKATAEYEIDIASVDTGNAMRDGHLKKDDIFDVAKFAKAKFKVHAVKAGTEADTYTATATLDLHGVSKDLPVNFKVVEKGADGSITIEGTSNLKRLDFGVGAKPGDLNAKDEIAISVRLKVANK